MLTVFSLILRIFLVILELLINLLAAKVVTRAKVSLCFSETSLLDLLHRGKFPTDCRPLWNRQKQRNIRSPILLHTQLEL